ncbi:MAG: segregation/condensation protein A [Acidobacteria bacterium]|nr:segregation/condensation protein A [Acidobacteriota bacterium]
MSDEPKPQPGTADGPSAPGEHRPDETAAEVAEATAGTSRDPEETPGSSEDEPFPAGEDAASPGPEPGAPPSEEGDTPGGPHRVTVPEGVESTLPEDVPRIQLPLFEGPLDLLLYLIRREKLDIHDIPIAPITREYMEYLDLMRELNLDVAGEFMVMAATLIHIKSKMLVPIEPTEAEGEEEYVDPREELAQRLLEFQRYKEAAGILHQQAQIRAAQWTRPDTVIPKFDDAGEEMLEAGLYDLIAAFKEMLDRRKALLDHEVETEGPSIEDRMIELLAMIGEGESLEFLELFASLETKAAMIVTFLALLELVRMKRVRVYQRGMFGAIRVFRPVGPPAEGSPTPAT